MAMNKKKAASIMYVLVGSIAGELAGKVLPFGGKWAPAIPAGLGAYLMLNKDEPTRMFGAGLLAAGGGKIVAQFIPGLSGIDDTQLTELYDRIVRDSGGGEPVSEHVLIGYGANGEEVYGPANSGSMSEQVLLGENLVY